MPNYVTNVVKVTGPDADIQRFRKDCFSCEKDGEPYFDFKKIIPMPESLNMPSGSSTDEAIIAYIFDNCTKPFSKDEKYTELVKNIFDKNYPETVYERTKKWISENGDDFVFYSRNNFTDSLGKISMKEAGKIYIENYKKYGFMTWYDWSYAIWNTKWNSCSTQIFEESPNSLEFSFDTAWSCPVPIFKKITRMFPSLNFISAYADEDFGSNCGELFGISGKFTLNIPKSHSKKAYEIAASVFEVDLSEEYVYNEKEKTYLLIE